MKTFFRWILRIIFSACLLLLLVVTIIALFQIPIDLTRFRIPLESIASKALKRRVNTEQSIILSNPFFLLKG
jgi:hypothetical protein